jgi:hypothetical protein
MVISFKRDAKYQSHAQHPGAIRAWLEIPSIAVVDDHRADVTEVGQIVHASAGLKLRVLGQRERSSPSGIALTLPHLAAPA